MTALHWFRARLQRRMVGTLALVLLALSLGFLVLLSGLYRARISAEQERAAMQIGTLLHASLENAMLKRDLPGLEAILADLGRDDDIRAIHIVNPEFEVRFATDPALTGQTLDLPLIRRALETRSPQAETLPEGTRAVEPVKNREPCQQCHGPMADHPVNGLLVIDYAGGGLDAEARRTGLLLALAGLAVTLATLAASAMVLRRTVTAPLAKLEAGTKALAAGEYDHRLPVAGQDEISHLSNGFNTMASGLQDAMNRLNTAQTTLQAVIDAIPDGIRVIGPDYRILMANRAYAAQVGQPLPQIIGQPCHASSHRRATPCPETLIVCPLAEASKGRLPLTCRQTHLNAAGAEQHMEIAAAPLTLLQNGQETPCVVEAIRDLDSQARLSQEQRLSELGLLAAGLAHEIHNPLSSITLLLDAAREDLAAGDALRAGDRLHTIGDELHRTLTLTNSLMALCTPPNDDPVLVEIDRVVPEALALLSFQARAAKTNVVLNITPGLRFVGSDGDLRMLVTNLVLNAFHAMPQGGTVRVSGQPQGPDVVLTIADAGIGISPADLSRIFLPFWTRRADGTPGRGLGLSIVQAVVSRWNGKIDVESSLGIGTTFTIRLPNPDAPNTRSPA